MQKLNTHHYDGRLKEKYKLLQEKTQTKLSFEDTLKEIRILVKGNNKALKMLNKLSQPNGNYDSKNDIHVKDLLPLVWVHVKTYDKSAKRVFVEQIVDIFKGSCPQGRTTRLLQCVEI